ncbi:hypothetical protein CAPTEDRAFT_201200 [Capitella teleta]|uniref:Uncharacterized protein n=1 Tax=Capitella teleta TaxID=283909 RepID=R7UZF2_CAPTE|nr:hypothetical protein CAPTEDRAFT_201200 [Capitella teleta]|eukprot:ELU11637.1 hypothetical protein CAPTEDRAFT_201200 [Capitella teleta]
MNIKKLWVRAVWLGNGEEVEDDEGACHQYDQTTQEESDGEPEDARRGVKRKRYNDFLYDFDAHGGVLVPEADHPSITSTPKGTTKNLLKSPHSASKAHNKGDEEAHGDDQNDDSEISADETLVRSFAQKLNPKAVKAKVKPHMKSDSRSRPKLAQKLMLSSPKILRGQKAKMQLANTGGQKFAEKRGWVASSLLRALCLPSNRG